MLALDDFESADAAADDDADALGVLRVDLQAGLSQREFGGRDAELDKAAHFLDFFAFDEAGGIEILDLTGDAAIKRGGVKLFDPGDAVPALANGLPALVGANTKRAQQPDSCNYYSARQQ